MGLEMLEYVQDMIAEINNLYLEQEVRAKIPIDVAEEFEEVMNGMRIKYMFLGIKDPEQEDIRILEAIVKKLKELKKGDKDVKK